MSILAGSNSKTWAGAIFVVSVAAVLYFLTAAHDIVVGDSPELITAAATLGVAHEPGYPLFTMLGHLFSCLSVGSIPFRVNLLSVICHGATVGVIYLTANRLTRSHLAALIAALLLAVNPTFWSWSLVAEVFPLNDLIAATLILFLLAWNEQPQQHALLFMSAFLAGLGLTNHQTIVLLGPASCFILWQQRSILREQPTLLLVAAVSFFAGLLPYAYIPWASAHHPTYNWGNVSSISDLIDVIRRRTYGSSHLVSVPGYTGGSVIARIIALLASFGLTTLLFIVVGLIAAYRQARSYFWFGLVGFLLAGPFFVWITNLNLATAPSALFVLQRFFLLPQVILAPFVAFGFLWIANLIGRYWRRTVVNASLIVTAMTAVSITLRVAMDYGRIDQSRNFIERRFTEDVWRTVESGSILIARGDIAFALMYFQKVEHIGADTELVLLPLLSTRWYVQQLRDQHRNITIPFDRYDGISNNLKKVIEANSNRPFCIVGTIGSDDHSLDENYWPYQRGLLLVVEPRSKNIPLEQMIQENERFFDSYHLPSPAAIRTDTFEADIMTMYAWPAFRIANDCATVGLRDHARKWYQRALAINPQFPKAREALARLEH